jgi:hypothetical protein
MQRLTGFVGLQVEEVGKKIYFSFNSLGIKAQEREHSP